MFRGNVARTGITTGSCIAQNLLGKRDENLAALRLVRDRVLARSAMGRKLIHWYYAGGDALGIWLDRHPKARSFAAGSLRAIGPAIAFLLRG